MAKLNVLVTDHSVLYRKNIIDTINSTEYGYVLHGASNIQIAIEWLTQSEIDVLFLDVYFLVGNGINNIRLIKDKHPNLEIIIMSNKDPESAETTLNAIDQGAMDFIIKPETKDLDKFDSSLKGKVDAIFAQIMVRGFLTHGKLSRGENSETSNSSNATNTSNTSYALNAASDSIIATDKTLYKSHRLNQRGHISFKGKIDLVLIASSTGGPVAIENVLRNLPKDFKKPILIVQHMPPDFTRALAEMLHRKFSLNVIEGKNGHIISEGEIIIAPGGMHMVIDENQKTNKTIKLLDTPYVNGVRPAADVLFKSVANTYNGRNILAVILTGMGNDGTKGVKDLKEATNCFCITQSEESCIVYGMPKCVYEAGLSDEVLDLKDIAFRIYQISKEG